MISHFSILPENQDVRAIEIAGGGLHARILSWGASLQDLRLDGHPSPLVLGFQRLEDYLAHSAHHGAIAGPVINRIGGGECGNAFSLVGSCDGNSGGHGGLESSSTSG